MQPSNILKIDSLWEGWCDKDYILLHACFQLLSDFVEQEMLKNNFPDWNADENTRAARKEIETLYEWWTVRKKQDDKGARFQEEYDQYMKDNEMLRRLIDVRMYLWT
jgi:hypothetical protein